MDALGHHCRDATLDPENDFGSRQNALYQRVADAAEDLAARGITPTVTRVRAALKGGSPNDIAPALKVWKESLAAKSRAAFDTPAIPVAISDLARELWQRATVAAALELKGGPAAESLIQDAEEADALRQQIQGLRTQLERESILYGELRAQAARHEAIARDALTRLEASETRERKHLRDLGSARQRIAELDAAMSQLRARPVAAKSGRPPKTPARSSKSPARRKPSRPQPAPPQRRPPPKRNPPPRRQKPRAPARRSALQSRKRR